MVRPSLRRFGVRRVAVPLDIIIPEDRLTVKMIGNLAGRLASQRGRQERDDAPGAASPRGTVAAALVGPLERRGRRRRAGASNAGFRPDLAPLARRGIFKRLPLLFTLFPEV